MTEFNRKHFVRTDSRQTKFKNDSRNEEEDLWPNAVRTNTKGLRKRLHNVAYLLSSRLYKPGQDSTAPRREVGGISLAESTRLMNRSNRFLDAQHR